MGEVDEEDVLEVINFLKSLGYYIPIKDERVVYRRLMLRLVDMEYPNNEEGWEAIVSEFEEEIINPQQSLVAYEGFN